MRIFTSPILGSYLCLLFLLTITCFFVTPAQAQIPDLIIKVGDTTGSPGEQNAVITVTLDNFFDEICAFKLGVQLNRPDIMAFQTNLDTIITTTYWQCLEIVDMICVDSAALPEDSSEFADFVNIDTTEQFLGSFDTTGTLISGWESVVSTTLSEQGLDIRVVANANVLGGPTNPGFPPQQGGVLFKLLGDVFEIPDELEDRTVVIAPQIKFLQFFGFSRCDGTSIGIETIFVEDTNYYRCIQWTPDSSECIGGYIQLTDSTNADSIEIFLDTVAILDTTKVLAFSGSLTVLTGKCANYDCDPNLSIDIADLTVLIDHLFINFPPLCNSVEQANIDCDQNNSIDIADLTVLIDHLFINFPPLCCE